jgi:nucleotide-binding universal stress UspA family protein
MEKGMMRVLVPLDGSALAEKALPVALQLVNEVHGELLLLRSTSLNWLLQDSQDHELEVINTAEDYLEQVRKTITDQAKCPLCLIPAHVKTLVAYKEPLRDLAEIAAFEHVDMIVMTTHGRSGIARMVLGSSASNVVQHSSLPVVLIHPANLPVKQNLEQIVIESVDTETQRILVTLDGTPEAEKALPAAMRLAKELDASLYLLRVVPPYIPFDYAGLGVAYVYDGASAQAETESLRAAAEDYLQQIQQRLREKQVESIPVVRVGDPAIEITAYAQALQARMVVMATHARHETGRLILGSVADEVMRNSNLPVMMLNIHHYKDTWHEQAIEAESVPNQAN